MRGADHRLRPPDPPLPSLSRGFPVGEEGAVFGLHSSNNPRIPPSAGSSWEPKSKSLNLSKFFCLRNSGAGSREFILPVQPSLSFDGRPSQGGTTPAATPLWHTPMFKPSAARGALRRPFVRSPCPNNPSRNYGCTPLSFGPSALCRVRKPPDWIR